MLFYKILLIILTAVLKISKVYYYCVWVCTRVTACMGVGGQLCRVSSPLPLCVGSGNRTQGARLVLYHGDISLRCDILCSSLLPLLCRVASLIILYFSFGYSIFPIVFLCLYDCGCFSLPLGIGCP